MSIRRALPAALVLGASLLLQSCVEYVPSAEAPPGPPPYPPPSAAAVPPAPVDLSLRQLLAPIALYPDPLLALILPSCTVPGDLSAANQYLVQYGDQTQLNAQPWDPAVRSLAHYPTIVAWLVENPAWTQEVGSAFVASPSEVMRAIQALRLEAMASGVLASTPQQQVYSNEGVICIIPNQPNSIFVPAYDPTIAFSDQGQELGVACVGFSGAYPVGPWLSLCFDWNTFGIWSGGWSVWHEGGLWHAPQFAANRAPPGFRRWTPSPRSVAPTPVTPGRTIRVQTPPTRPIPGTPAIRSRYAPPPGSPSPTQQGRGNPPQPQPGSRAQTPVVDRHEGGAPQGHSATPQPQTGPRVQAPETASHGGAAPKVDGKHEAPKTEGRREAPAAAPSKDEPPADPKNH